jgi:hypothetical protein
VRGATQEEKCRNRWRRRVGRVGRKERVETPWSGLEEGELVLGSES